LTDELARLVQDVLLVEGAVRRIVFPFAGEAQLALGTVTLVALLARLLITTVAGDRVRLPDPRQLTVCLQLIVAGFDHATSLHVHDLWLPQVA
jgi:hypothetical protein